MFVWVWQIENLVKNKYKTIDNLINHLKELKINDVCIKYHEGSSEIGGGVNFKNDFYKYAPVFKKNGFKVGTWGYNYFNHLDDEANLIIEALNNSDYYIYDPEVDVSNKFTQAEYVCKKVRQTHTHKTIGYASFPIVSMHRDIPYDIFNKYCDFASPQDYFGEMQWSVAKAISKTIADHKQYNLDKPIYPSIQTYRQVENIYEQFDKYNFDYFGLWDLDEIDKDCENWLKNRKSDVDIFAQNKFIKELLVTMDDTQCIDMNGKLVKTFEKNDKITAINEITYNNRLYWVTQIGLVLQTNTKWIHYPYEYCIPVEVTASVLNIRENPTINSKDVGDFHKGDKLTVIGFDHTKKWGEVMIGRSARWISMDWVKIL